MINETSYNTKRFNLNLNENQENSMNHPVITECSKPDSTKKNVKSSNSNFSEKTNLLSYKILIKQETSALSLKEHFYKNLSNEIEKLDIKIHSPLSFVKNNSDIALEILKKFFRENFSCITLKLFGSKANNLDINDSDLDIVLFLHYDDFPDNSYHYKYIRENCAESICKNHILKKIMQKLIIENISSDGNIQVIDCRIPIIKGKCKTYNIQFDIR